jgi:hypothetical protein
VKTGWNLAETSNEGCGSRRVLLPMMMIIMIMMKVKNAHS